MARKPVGEMVVSLDLETAAYTKAQQKILAESKEAASTINANFQRLGVTSDQIYNAMAKRAELAFRQIGLSAKSSLAEVERAYAAMVANVNTANQQMAKNPLFETLGIRSMAAIEAQKKAVIDSFEAIKTIGFKNDQERINATRAYNAKLKELNKEMVSEHGYSLASMQRAVLRFYATAYVVTQAFSYLSVPFVKGFKAVEEYNTAIASMAAMVVTFGQNIRGLSLEDQWKSALAYSTAMIPILERIAAKTLLSGQETIALANAFARSGVFLDANNAKQIESFTRISNALPLMTQGQEITRQINTEVRSLMTGMNVQSSMMLITLREIDPEIEKHMAQWRATDTVLEHIGDLLKGFGPATEILEKQWQAVKTSLDTTVTQILRGAMKQSYEDIIALTQELDKWLQANKQSIADTVDQLRATAKMLKLIYDTAPSGTFEAASMGIIGKILWGNQVGLMIAAISLINSKLKETGNNLGALPKKAFDAWEAIKNIGTRPGPVEYTVPPIPLIPLTAQEKANLNVIKIMKMMDETILKNHKESIAEYDKETKTQAAAFREVGASEDYINKYLEKRIVLKEQQFNLDKKAGDAAKKAAEEQARLMEKIWKLQEDVSLAGLDGSRKAFEQNRIEAEKLRHELENTAGWNRLSKAQKDAAFFAIDSIQKMKDQGIVNTMVQKSREDNAKSTAKETAETDKAREAYDRLMNTVAPVTDRTYEMAKAIDVITLVFEKGSPAWQEAIDKVKAFNDAVSQKSEITGAQKEADKARKMVTFYKEIGLNRDEYFKASLVWIENEAKVKELEYGKDFDKAKWIADQKFLLYNESEKKIYDMQLSYLKDMGKEYTKEYRDIAILKIKNEADALEREFQNAAGGGGQTAAQQAQLKAEQDLTQQLMTEWEERLRAYADYLAGMGDKEGSNNALKAAEDMAKKKIELQDRVAKNALTNMATMFDKEAYIAKKIQQMDATTLQGKLALVSEGFGAIGTALNGISGLYVEGSEQAKRWQEAANVMMVAQKAVAVVQAVVAVATQAGSGPYVGFVTMAAMAASMVALLGQIGVSFSSGSSSAPSAAYGQNTTVLGGENGQASESIQKSWELLEDTYDMQYQKLSGIYNEMKDLNNNITGLVAGIIRGGGKFDAASFGIAEGVLRGSAEKAAKSIISQNAGILTNIGNFANKPLVDIVNGIFGGKVTTTVMSAGIALGKITIDALLSGAIMSARQYASIKKEKDGGWFGSDKTSYSTMYKALDESTALLFTKVFKNIGQTLFSLASSLGTDVQKALEYEFAAGKINLQGLNAEKIDKKLNAYFSKIGDKAVEALFGSITKGYQKVGEGLMETAIRLVTDKEVILETLRMTNQAFVAADTEIIKTREIINTEWTRWKALSKTQRFLQFGGQTPEKYITETYVAGIDTAMQKTIAFSEALIEMAGGLDKLQEAAATYYDKFFSDVEKQARLQGQLSGIMSDMNLVLPDTRAGYRSIVEGLDLNTESGQRAYITLIGLAEAADTYYSVLEDATDAATNSQNDYIESLKRLSETIAKWLADLNLSTLAPVQSAEGWRTQYTSMLSAATVPGVDSGVVTDFLSYATKYLEFERTYGGNYQAVYDAVVADVLRIQAATLAAIPAHASGGLTSGISFAGERGQEWIVPTYEPQRSSFLRDVGVDSNAIGKSIAKYLTNEASGGSGSGKDIHVHINIDGREIGVAVAKQIPRNSDLSDAIRSVQ